MRMLMGANGIYADGKAQPMTTNGIYFFDLFVFDLYLFKQNFQMNNRINVQHHQMIKVNH
jgi:hypothetical protein